MVRITLLLTALTFLAACEAKPNVQVVWETDEDGKKKKAEEQPGTSEEELRAAYEQRLLDRENAPEPELNPEEPREKGKLVWRMGKGKLNSIYNERAEMIAMLKRIKLDDKKDRATIKEWITPLTEFGIGRSIENMEKAPAELCKLLSDIRVPTSAMIEKGRKELALLKKVEEALLAKQEAGTEVLQREWDKFEDERKKWSQPVGAGKRLLLVVKSVLEEALVLAEYGPRRVQISLRDCLTKVAETPLELDLAQVVLDKVIKRSKWYRDLRTD
jgi:hypothetical protein